MKTKSIKPLKPCEQCWKTFEPKKKREQSMIDGSGGAYLKLRFEIFRRDNFTCQYCGRTVKDKVILHIDHIIPKSKGGNLSMGNLITACFDCNEGKRDVLLTEREIRKIKEGKLNGHL